MPLWEQPASSAAASDALTVRTLVGRMRFEFERAARTSLPLNEAFG